LLGDTQIAGKSESAPTDAETAPLGAVGPGLGSLLTAGRNGSPVKEEEPVRVKPVEAPYVPLSVYRPPKPEPAPEPEPVASSAPEVPSARPVSAPRWLLIGADLLLVALAALLVFKSPAPLKVWELGLCLGAVVLGGILTCLAIMMPPSGK
jgi:hypothetical protein